MKSQSSNDLYVKNIESIRFERNGLFKLVQEKFGCNTTLYPGSSVHITPSFYIPHIVYIDNNPEVVQFFNNINTAMYHINRNKIYKRSAFIQFIDQDYTFPLPLLQQHFDLLISLFAPNVIQSCKTYLKKGGFLLTHSFQNNIEIAVNSPEFKIIAAVRFYKKAYELVQHQPAELLQLINQTTNKKYLKQNSKTVDYIENETYLIFEKI